jgi:hemerythrin
MGLDWAEHLSIGNAMIDAEHKNLIVAVNSVEHAIGTRDTVALSKAFDLLDTYMNIHFRNEERVAEAINFPFAKNKQEHRHLLKEMKYMREELEAKNGIWPDELIKRYSRFLSGWMADHIVKEDMQMKPALQTYPYDFKPG